MSMDATDLLVEQLCLLRPIAEDPYASNWDRAAARRNARALCRRAGHPVPWWAREQVCTELGCALHPHPSSVPHNDGKGRRW